MLISFRILNYVLHTKNMKFIEWWKRQNLTYACLDFLFCFWFLGKSWTCCGYSNATSFNSWIISAVREGGLVKQSRNSILLLAYWLEATPSIIQPFRCSEGHGDRTSPVPHRAQKNFSKCGAHMRAKVAGNLVTWKSCAWFNGIKRYSLLSNWPAWEGGGPSPFLFRTHIQWHFNTYH